MGKANRGGEEAAPGNGEDVNDSEYQDLVEQITTRPEVLYSPDCLKQAVLYGDRKYRELLADFTNLALVAASAKE